ncbi:hypothetical protein [Pseudomonas sp. R5(2019)]|uniref:hypothetical protein n=1 Tax=Pseudomonas sp. R5(2019) TaxID=2697566 RepID=UPI0014130151|nr:hypothetical protein [Pseudomonas sp. R5(2019)]NBA97391.1 hypothetical protein [Pseudomonas sp. R5(2019)]
MFADDPLATILGELKMTAFEQANASEQLRIADRKAKVLRAKARAISPPIITEVITGYESTGLVPVSALGADLELGGIRWENWAPHEESDTLEIEWRLLGATDWTPVSDPESIDGSAAGPAFPLTRFIPRSAFEAFKEQKFEVRFTVTDFLLQQYNSGIAKLHIDNAPIWDGSDFPPAIILPHPVITDSVLTAERGVIVEIPDFVDEYKTTAKVLVAWLKDIPDTMPPSGNIFEVVPVDRKVTISATDIQALGSGKHCVVYILVDAAGNPSAMSYPRNIQVALGALPSGFPVPRVPLAQAADGYLIDRADAAEGVTVAIDTISNVIDADRIQVVWGNVELEKIPYQVLKPFPIVVPINWEQLKEAYDFTAGGSQTTEVTYRVFRGEYQVGSNHTEVEVDLEIVGPEIPGPDPDPGAPHPELIPAVLTSDSGLPNQISKVDIGKAASVEITLHPDLVLDSVVTLFYDNVPVGNQTITDLSVNLTFTVPWTTIDAQGSNPALLIDYRVAPKDSPNPFKSKPTPVAVDIEQIILDAVEYPDAFTGGSKPRLVCSSLQAGVDGNGVPIYGIRVRVPLSKYVVVGAEVTLNWEATKLGVPIAGTELEETVTVPVGSVGHFDWFVEYEKHVKPTYGGSADQSGEGHATYTISVGGDDHSAADHKIDITMSGGPGGGSCPIPPAP